MQLLFRMFLVHRDDFTCATFQLLVEHGSPPGSVGFPPIFLEGVTCNLKERLF